MNILLDENLDWRLERDLPGHTVASVPRIGWAGMKNGELLRRSAARFDVLVTMDKGIYQQQNLTGLSLAVVALRAKSNRLADTRPFMPALLLLLPDIQAGEFRSLPALP
jgi:predicted nuclease of predicted toxin-antitoxin system